MRDLTKNGIRKIKETYATCKCSLYELTHRKESVNINCYNNEEKQRKERSKWGKKKGRIESGEKHKEKKRQEKKLC